MSPAEWVNCAELHDRGHGNSKMVKGAVGIDFVRVVGVDMCHR